MGVGERGVGWREDGSAPPRLLPLHHTHAVSLEELAVQAAEAREAQNSSSRSLASSGLGVQEESKLQGALSDGGFSSCEGGTLLAGEWLGRCCGVAGQCVGRGVSGEVRLCSVAGR